MTLPDGIIETLARQLGWHRFEVRRWLDACEVIPFVYRGRVTGAVVLAGRHEIHFIADPECRGRCGSRRELWALFESLLAERNFLTTRIPVGTPKKDRTGERMGFIRTWCDGDFDYYIMTERPYARTKNLPES